MNRWKHSYCCHSLHLRLCHCISEIWFGGYSAPLLLPRPSFNSSPSSLNAAAAWPQLSETPLSVSVSFFVCFFFLSHQSHKTHFTYLRFQSLSVSLSSYFSTTPPASRQLCLVMWFLFPLNPPSISLFPVWQWHWKVFPCHFKERTAQELLVNAAWGAGLVHALQCCVRYRCMVDTAEDASLGWFLWNRKPVESVALLFPEHI